MLSFKVLPKTSAACSLFDASFEDNKSKTSVSFNFFPLKSNLNLAIVSSNNLIQAFELVVDLSINNFSIDSFF